MKRNRTIILIIIGLFSINFIGCKKNADDNPRTVPILTTKPISSITQISAISGGDISSDGGAEITSRGICWSTNSNPSIKDNISNDGTGVGSYTSSLSKLSPYTKYSVRAYAINSAGIGYGDILMFSSEAETINDYDGNIYHVIPIGNQKWLAENLSTTHFQNGNSITHRRVSNTSIYDSSACYWDYDDNFISNPPYGRFYSLLAITDNRNICPPGYHVPSEDEWTTLLYFLGGESVAGGKMKATGTIEDKTGYWHTPNTGATNESGFSAIPAGGAGVNGLNQFISDMRGTDCNWWSAKTVRLHGYIFGYTWFVNLNDTRLLHYGSQGYNIATGLSVRCIKDSK